MLSQLLNLKPTRSLEVWFAQEVAWVWARPGITGLSAWQVTRYSVKPIDALD